MSDRRSGSWVPMCLALGAALVLWAGGCEEKKPPPSPEPPPPPPVVARPDPVDMSAVLQQARADARVQFPQGQSPADRSLAEAVIGLSSALARGDAAAMGQMLDPKAKRVLEELVASGEWASATKPIEAVRVVSLSGRSEDRPTRAEVVLAVQVPGVAYLVAWDATRAGDRWTFSNKWVQGDRRARASEFDGVTVAPLVLVEATPEPAADPAPAKAAPAAPAPSASPGRGRAPGSGS